MTASASRAKCHAGGGPRSSEGLGLAEGQFPQRAATVNEEAATRHQCGPYSWQGEQPDLWMPPIECANSECKGEVKRWFSGLQGKGLGSGNTKGQLTQADLVLGAGQSLADGRRGAVDTENESIGIATDDLPGSNARAAADLQDPHTWLQGQCVNGLKDSLGDRRRHRCREA